MGADDLTARQRAILREAYAADQNSRGALELPPGANRARPYEALEDLGLGSVVSGGFRTVSIVPAHVRQLYYFHLTAEGKRVAEELS